MNAHNKQLGYNSISNLVVFIVNMLINIWIVPYLISKIGISVYGTFPLAISIISFLSIVTYSLNNAVTRFLTLSIHRNDPNESSIIFNSAFFGSLLLLVLITPLIYLFNLHIDKVLSIPLGYKTDVIFLYYGIFASFVVTSISANFGVSPFAINRIDLKNIPDILNNILRFIIILYLFNFWGHKVYYIGFAYFTSSIIALILSIYIWAKCTPDMNINIKHFDVGKFKTLSNLGLWIIINQIGSLLFLNIDLIVVNKFFGPKECGEYASVLQWSILLRSVAGILAGSLTPLVMIHFASNNIHKIIMITSNAMRVIGFSMAFIIGVICGFSGIILHYWLGAGFEQFAPLLILQISHLVLNLSVLPLFAINLTLDKLKVPGIVSLVMGVLNVLLAIFIPQITGMGVIGVALAGAIVLTLKNSIFTTWYCSKILGTNMKQYMLIISSSLFFFIIVYICSVLISKYINTSSPFEFVSAIFFLFLLYITVLWSFSLNAEEKLFVLSSMPRFVNFGNKGK